MILIFILTGIFSIVSGFQAKEQATKAEKEISSLRKEMTNLKDMANVDTPETDSFFRRFLTTYFTVSTDQKAQEEREHKLKEYNQAIDYKLPSVPKVNQTIVTMRSYGYEQIDDYFLVTYTVETKTDEKEPKNFVSNVTIPFKKDKKGYSVLSLPYQQEYNPNSYVANSKETLKSYKGQELEDKKAREAIKAFCEQFLTEYQANNKENLKYLMNDVEGLSIGKEIELKGIHYYGTEEKPVIELNIIVSNKQTGIGFSENMRLHLNKNEDKKYFINKLEHY